VCARAHTNNSHYVGGIMANAGSRGQRAITILGRRRFMRPYTLSFARVALCSISCEARNRERAFRNTISDCFEPSRACERSRASGDCGGLKYSIYFRRSKTDRSRDAPIARVIGSEGLVRAIGCSLYRTILPFEESKGCARSMTKA